MFSFKGFQTKAKNKHLEHLEDQIIDEGSKGGQNAVNFLVAIRNMLAGKSSRKDNIHKIVIHRWIWKRIFYYLFIFLNYGVPQTCC